MSECVELIRSSGGLVHMGDSRDMVVDAVLRKTVWAWCESQSVTAEYQGTLAKKDVWRVRNDEQRAWFMLRWS